MARRSLRTGGMQLDRSDVRFTRDDAARALSLPLSVIDALIRGGSLKTEVRGGRQVINARALEGVLRDALLHLYRAEATASQDHERAPEPMIAAEELAPADPPPPVETDDGELEIELSNAYQDQPLITRSISDFESTAGADAEHPDLRLVPRYVPRRQVGGTFGRTRFTVVQISATGIRIRHQEPILPGDEARVTFSILKAARSFVAKARVVWTSVAQRGGGEPFCVSGLRIIDRGEQIAAALDILRASRDLEIEAPARTAAKRPAGPASGLSDEEVASIIRAVRTFSTDPVAASRWYTRAKFALADSKVREEAPIRPREREEVLAVWEYLGRRIAVKSITGVVSWIHQTRSASAAPPSATG